MKISSALFAAILALSASVASAGNTAAPWTAPVCSAGPSGDRPAGTDADADGVVDSEDWCPRSAPGDRVGANGCASWEVPVRCEHQAPTSAAAPARVVPVLELPEPSPAPAGQAAPPPAPVAVEASDSDHDGVSDDEDKCPGTPRGVAVDSRGCADIAKVVLKGVNFATGSAKLLPAASETLRSVASAMKASPKVEVEVGGYTDSSGKADRNQGLSERRAKAVKDFLVKAGVAADRLSTKGYGQSDPVDTNDTPAGRANNRRVAFKVTS